MHSPVISLTTLTTRCFSLLCYNRLFTMKLLNYSFVLFVASAFLLWSTTFFSATLAGQLITHHITPPANNTPTSTVPLSPPPCCSLAHAPFASAVSFLLLFVLLSGDIELNPGPSAFTLCTLNIRSILHPLHSTALSDLIDTHNPDLFCLTETWTKPTTTC